MKDPTIWVIGDVHGCIYELVQLVDKLNLQKYDTLVFLGDLIHKGTSSAGVLGYVRGLRAAGYHVLVICGNHEEKHLRWLRHEQRRIETGKKNPVRHTSDYPLVPISQEDVEFLNQSRLSWNFGGVTMVHGGIPSSMDDLPFETHAEWRAMSSKDREYVGQVLRLRYITPAGKMVSLGKQTDEDSFWAESYDGRFGTVLFGHNPWMQDQPKIFPHALGLDLGCVHGGHLCAVETDGHSVLSYETVRAQRVYKERLKLK